MEKNTEDSNPVDDEKKAQKTTKAGKLVREVKDFIEVTSPRPPLDLDQLMEKWKQGKFPALLESQAFLKKYYKKYEPEKLNQVEQLVKKTKNLEKKANTKNYAADAILAEANEIEEQTIEFQTKVLEKLSTQRKNTQIKSPKLSRRYWLMFILGMIGSGIIGWLFGYFLP